MCGFRWSTPQASQGMITRYSDGGVPGCMYLHQCEFIEIFEGVWSLMSHDHPTDSEWECVANKVNVGGEK